jgi:hypothetical protein
MKAGEPLALPSSNFSYQLSVFSYQLSVCIGGNGCGFNLPPSGYLLITVH